MNLLNASGESAGQTVFHFHIHIIPRRTNDGINGFPKFDGGKKQIAEMYEKLGINEGIYK